MREHAPHSSGSQIENRYCSNIMFLARLQCILSCSTQLYNQLRKKYCRRINLIDRVSFLRLSPYALSFLFLHLVGGFSASFHPTFKCAHMPISYSCLFAIFLLHVEIISAFNSYTKKLWYTGAYIAATRSLPLSNTYFRKCCVCSLAIIIEYDTRIFTHY